ncbi:hypothetical protein MWU78_21455 [Arenibacter sp. F26102]|uniref:GH39 family glycosyl hydrolase n=1 Tax=Arenibacter sp. F26102 TaxID=2926416 RepID=UPI001FF4409E|nr:hypothetical protein [Arenibacter sp. F26102]MCK0148228.1 hypothetical protein [Arenibacter sp. F26102]
MKKRIFSATNRKKSFRVWFMILILSAFSCKKETFQGDKEGQGNGEFIPDFTQRSLGTMTAFWRTGMMTGGKDQITPWHLYKNPVAYLDETDFPYNYSRYDLDPNEPFVLHADVFSYVRFLSSGEDDTYDLAERVDGQVMLRKSEVAKRFAATEASGVVKNYIIVLDNIPFCFPNPEDVRVETYGQTSLPADMDEWQSFITELCKEIKLVLGDEKANKLSFRLGTEAHNGERFRYSDPQVMLDFYKITAQAVKSVIPEAKFGPYNTHTPWRAETQVLKFNDLINFCKENNLPLDFVSFSWYVQGSDALTEPSGFLDFLSSAESAEPALSNVPKNYQEFGALGVNGNQYVRPSSDNAAAMFNMLMESKAGGFTDTYHWPVVANISQSPEASVLNGLGWMFQALDHTIGGDSYLLNTEVEGNSKSRVKALGAFKCDNGNSYLIVSSFNTDINKKAGETVRVMIPKQHKNYVKSDPIAKAASLDRLTCPLLAIRNDLANANMLNADYKNRLNVTTYFPVHYVLVAKSVINREQANDFISTNQQRYMDLCKSSLVLKDKGVEIEEMKDGLVYELSIKANSISVIKL